MTNKELQPQTPKPYEIEVKLTEDETMNEIEVKLTEDELDFLSDRYEEYYDDTHHDLMKIIATRMGFDPDCLSDEESDAIYVAISDAMG